MDKIVITIAGVGLIGFIWWFFFGKKEEEKQGQVFDIVVDGGYKPSLIKVRKDLPVTLNFVRKDENSCLEEVVIPDFKIKKYLPMYEKVKVEFIPTKLGKYQFHCGMNMYFGTINVV